MPGWMQEKWYISHYHRDRLKRCTMDPRARWTKELQNELDAAEETQVWLKTVKLCFRGLLTFTHDGIFICRAGGGVWGESGQTLLLPAAASVQQPSISSRFPCLHTRQHSRRRVIRFISLAHCLHALKFAPRSIPREWQECLATFISFFYVYIYVDI